jgi:SNF2 family DNA or RNA helicase
MTFTLLPHQEIGVKFLINREPHDGSKTKLYGSILADEMGLGKTIQTIALITRSPLNNTLLCCPPTLSQMWKSQLNRFAPHINTMLVTDAKSLHSILTSFKPDTHNVLICSYAISYRRPELLDFAFDRIVCDEAHLFRNPKSKVYINLMKMKAKTKLILTGTPIQNKIGDLVTLINFIIGRELVLTIDFVKMFIKERMIRRKITEIGVKIPSLEINKVELKSNTTNKTALELTNEFEFNHHFEKMIRRKQASIFPSALNKSFYASYDMSPLSVCNEKSDTIVSRIIEDNHNCIVFTEFKDELAYIKQRLIKIAPNKRIESISGETSLDERQRLATDTSINILIIQINTAGIGLNLQHFNIVHFTNIQWNPSTTDQAIGRINRIGQEHDMKVFIYTFTDSIDDRIAFIAKKKRELIESII